VERCGIEAVGQERGGGGWERRKAVSTKGRKSISSMCTVARVEGKGAQKKVGEGGSK